MKSALSIGFVARQTGCSVPTIRYYEEIGLLPPSPRSDAGQRQFDQRTLQRLTFIRRCREFGFPVEQVRELVGLVDDADRPCAEVRDVAATQLAAVRRRLEELKSLEASLCALVCSCESACVGGPAVDCTILEDLAVPMAGAEGVQAAAGSCCAPKGCAGGPSPSEVAPKQHGP